MKRWLVLVMMAILGGSLHGQTFTVTNANFSGSGSLASALTAANAYSGAATINFNSGLNITLTGELPILTNPTGISINGNNSVINGGSTSNTTGFRGFFIGISPDIAAVSPGLPATTATNWSLNNLTIQNTNARGGKGSSGGAGLGGGVFLNAGTLTTNNVQFVNNRAVGGNGSSVFEPDFWAGGGMGGNGHFGGGGFGIGADGGLFAYEPGKAGSFTGGASGGNGGSNAQPIPGGINGGGGGSTATTTFAYVTGAGGGGIGGQNGHYEPLAFDTPSGFVSGNGGFGGGGGILFLAQNLGGNGGYGGGSAREGGYGGFGGGAGLGSRGPGFGGGQSNLVPPPGGETGGGGGLGAGAGIFVRQGAELVLIDSNFSGGSAVGGQAGGQSPGSGLSLGSGIFLAGNVTIYVGAGKRITIADNLGGGYDAQIDGSIYKDGPGVLRLAGTNSYTGFSEVGAGTLVFANTSALPSNTEHYVIDYATLGLGVGTSSGLYTAANITSLYNNTLANITMSPIALVGIDTTAGNFTYTQSLGFSGRGLVKLGPNTLTLTGNNEYNGGTVLDEGTLSITDNANLGSINGRITFQGGTLRITGGTFSTLSRPITWRGGGFDIDVGNAINVTTPISGSGMLTKYGAGFLTFDATLSQSGGVTVSDGTLILTANNSFTGGVTIGPSALLSIASDANLGASANGVTFESGNIRFTQNLTTSRTFILNGNANNFDLPNGVTATITSSISGPGALAISGLGTLVLTGSNSYTTTYLLGGTLVVSNDSNLGTEGGTLFFGNDATLRVDAGFNSTRPMRIFSSSGIISVPNASHVLTLSGDTTDSALLVKAGAGTLSLTGMLTHTGGTLVNGGTLALGRVGGSTGLNGTTFTVNSGATLRFDSNDNFGSHDSTLGPTVVVTGGTVTNSGAYINALQNLTLNDGTLTGVGGFGGYASYSVRNTLTSTGTSQIIIGTANNGALALSQAGTTVFDVQSGTLTVNAVITNNVGAAGNLFKTGPGTLVLNSRNTYTGGTTVSAGILAMGNDGQLTGGSALASTVTVSSGATVRFDTNNNFGNYVTATGPSVVVNGGTVTNSGGYFNQIQNLTLNDGTLTGVGGFPGYGSYAVRNTLTSTGTSQITLGTSNNGGLALSQAGTTTFDVQNGSLAVNAVITNSFGSSSSNLSKSGNGTLVLTQANTYSGGTLVNAGTVAVTGNNSLGANAAPLTMNGGTLQFLNSMTINHPVILSTASISTFFPETDLSVNLSAPVTGDGELIIQGRGRIYITSDANTWSGTTRVRGQVVNGQPLENVLYLGDPNGGPTGVLGSGPVVLENGGIYVLRNNAVTVSNAISGTGTVYMGENGILTLTGINSYDGGGTFIASGTVAVAADVNLGAATAPVRIFVGTLRILGTSYTTSDRPIIIAPVPQGPGGTIDIAEAANSFTLTQPVTGHYLNKVGPGTLVLNGANQLQAIRINAGTLRGTGSTTGSVTVASGATLHPGVGTSGLFTINGNLDFAHGAVLGATVSLATGSTILNKMGGVPATGLSGINLLVDLNNSSFTLGDSYGFQIAGGMGDQGTLSITNPSRFTFINVDPAYNIIDPELFGTSSGALLLGFTVIPVPEPAMLGLALLGGFLFHTRRR
ncbi:hypothetical protein BH11PLA2_BH11PLA2_38130 [soil metagenome]